MNSIIKRVLRKIEKKGYKAYVTGGYVRDYLLGVKSRDIDIATSMPPGLVNKLFRKSKLNEYGCVSFKVDKLNFEITTFRKESSYVKRKPTSIKYISSLEEDAARRDITINSIYIDKLGRVTDPFNAIDELKSKTVKLIASKKNKLREDPLRSFRIIRFASKYNFEIDDETSELIDDNVKFIKSLSCERVRGELVKILTCKNFKYAVELLKYYKINEILQFNLDNVKFTTNVHLLFLQINISDTYLTKDEKKEISAFKNIISYGKINEEVIYKYDIKRCLDATILTDQRKKDVKRMYRNMKLNDRKKLRITSEKIKEISLLEGKKLGNLINEIKRQILNNNLKNKPRDIMNYIKK